MAERRPLVLINGVPQELPAGDTVPSDGTSSAVLGVFYENDTLMPSDYSVPAGKNAQMVGPLEIPDGGYLEIADGQALVIH